MHQVVALVLIIHFFVLAGPCLMFMGVASYLKDVENVIACYSVPMQFFTPIECAEE